MNTRQLMTFALVLIVSITISGCGTGQLSGPTTTPTTTMTLTPLPTLTPTITPTPRPDPVTVLEDWGFIANPNLDCGESCTRYSKDQWTSVAIYGNGKFKMDLNQVPSIGVRFNTGYKELVRNILSALYPEDIVLYVMDTANFVFNIGSGESTKVVGGYTIDINMVVRSGGSYLEISITP